MAFDFVKQQAFRLGSQVLSNKIANLPGLAGLSNGGVSQSPTASIDQVYDKRSTENLSFPLDVEGDPGIGNHGHYIMFFINAQEKARLHLGAGRGGETDRFGRSRPIQRSVVEGNKENSIPNRLRDSFNIKTNGFDGKPNKNGHGEQLNDNISGDALNEGQENINGNLISGKTISKLISEGDAGVALRRPPTRRLKTAIAMYMPASVQVQYGADYTDTPMGVGVQAGLQIYDALKGQNPDAARQVVNVVEETVKEAGLRGILGLGSMLPLGGGLEEAESITRGRIITNRLELAFKGIGKREFSYTFKMVPRSKEEAEEIRRIIFAFKFNMLPEFTDGNRQGRRLTVPSTFDIQYMYAGQQNQFLHNISTCVLESMDVTYGGDRYKTYENIPGDGSPPTETSIGLKFREMEIITRERVNEGY